MGGLVLEAMLVGPDAEDQLAFGGLGGSEASAFVFDQRGSARNLSAIVSGRSHRPSLATNPINPRAVAFDGSARTASVR